MKTPRDKPQWSVGLSCMDPLRLERDLQAVHESGCRSVHIDLTPTRDSPEVESACRMVHGITTSFSLACVCHLYAEPAEPHIQRLADAGADTLIVHQELCTHTHRTLTQIREAGAKPAVALNPATPLTKIEYLLPFVDCLHVLVREVGNWEEEIARSAYERTRILRDNLDYRESKALLQVEGCTDARSAAELVRYGADAVVIDAGTLPQDGELKDSLPTFLEAVAIELKVS